MMEDVQETPGTQLSLGSKLGLIFTSPRRVFESLKLRPDWLVPTIIIAVISMASAFFLKDITIEMQKQKIMASEKIPDEKKEAILQSFDQSGNMQMIMGMAGAVIFVFVSFAVVAGLFLFTGNVILGGQSNFKTMLAIYAWGFMASVPEAIIKIPLMIAKNSIHVYTSLAILFDTSESETVLFKIANAVDIFALWRVALWAIGFGVVYKFSQGKSYAAIGVWYLIWIAVSIWLSSLFQGFLG
jgi:hypothetical protein